MELRPVIQMGDVAWSRGVLRLPQKGHICVVCRALSPTFLEFRTHIDPVSSDVEGRALGFAPDVQARLLLVAEDANGL